MLDITLDIAFDTRAHISHSDALTSRYSLFTCINLHSHIFPFPFHIYKLSHLHTHILRLHIVCVDSACSYFQSPFTYIYIYFSFQYIHSFTSYVWVFGLPCLYILCSQIHTFNLTNTGLWQELSSNWNYIHVLKCIEQIGATYSQRISWFKKYRRYQYIRALCLDEFIF